MKSGSDRHYRAEWDAINVDLGNRLHRAEWDADYRAMVAEGYADALIEIAAAWDESEVAGPPWCSHCDTRMDDDCGCFPDCPGLLARKALGVG